MGLCWNSNRLCGLWWNLGHPGLLLVLVWLWTSLATRCCVSLSGVRFGDSRLTRPYDRWILAVGPIVVPNNLSFVMSNGPQRASELLIHAPKALWLWDLSMGYSFPNPLVHL